jgi:hypothetical protein
MPAKMTLLCTETKETQQGPWIIKATFAATGLSANGANTVPFPAPLSSVPRRVFLTPTGDGAAGALISLDTSQGATDATNSFTGGKLGVDQNNLYVYIGNATEFQATVEYSQS